MTRDEQIDFHLAKMGEALQQAAIHLGNISAMLPAENHRRDSSAAAQQSPAALKRLAAMPNTANADAGPDPKRQAKTAVPAYCSAASARSKADKPRAGVWAMAVWAAAFFALAIFQMMAVTAATPINSVPIEWINWLHSSGVILFLQIYFLIFIQRPFLSGDSATPPAARQAGRLLNPARRALDDLNATCAKSAKEEA